jgi:site-specific DNA recombinase
VIREAAGRVLAGEPLRAIAVDLTRREVPAPREGGWTGGVLKRILTAPRLIAVRVHRGERFPGMWPRILDVETFDRVERILTNPARTANPAGPGRRAPKLLTGIASCSKCGAGLNSKVNRGHRRYFCRRCGGTNVFADRVDALVEAMLFDAVDTPALARTLRRQEVSVDVAAVSDEILRLEAELLELAAELGEGRLTMLEWKAARQGIDRRLVDLRSSLGQHDTRAVLAPYVGRAGALRAAWEADELTMAEKRTVVAAVFETIIIDPPAAGSRRFDPDRVRPVWR